MYPDIASVWIIGELLIKVEGIGPLDQLIYLPVYDGAMSELFDCPHHTLSWILHQRCSVSVLSVSM